MSLPNFEAFDLARRVEALPWSAVDALPFGVILLDDDGLVKHYSETERRQSGSGTHSRVGLDFFNRIAPCMNNPNFLGRIEAARRAGTIDLAFSHIGDFEDLTRELHVRVQSCSAGGYWIFLQRLGVLGQDVAIERR